MYESDELITLLANLRSLVQQAEANGNKHDPKTALPHYWYGVKVGYEDAANRLEELLQVQK